MDRRCPYHRRELMRAGWCALVIGLLVGGVLVVLLTGAGG
jgi:hypothetical protein